MLSSWRDADSILNLPNVIRHRCQSLFYLPYASVQPKRRHFRAAIAQAAAPNQDEIRHRFPRQFTHAARPYFQASLPESFVFLVGDPEHDLSLALA
jgi:hypothetical protein